MPLPTPEEYDLRRLDRAFFERLEGKPATRRSAALGDHERESAVGSNNWAVAGARAKGGGALVANDMHLGLNVPNIWYRARLVVAPAGLDVTGVTLPGVPAIVAGSNRHVAWGFTNSYGDFQDLVRLERGPTDDTYLAAGGPRAFERGHGDARGRARQAGVARRPEDDLGSGDRRRRRGPCARARLDRASARRDGHVGDASRARAGPR